MKQKLLLHCCCAPCSSAIIENLSNYYDITLYFYNPNINKESEYYCRLNELSRFIVDAGYKKQVKLVWEDYNTEPFYNFAKTLATDHEGGNRCRSCYGHRLSKTAEYAYNNNFKQFSTTLTISPYKDSAVINSIGTAIASEYPTLMYMPFDFGFLYTRSLELCEKYDLYQQDYCGCIYSI